MDLQEKLATIHELVADQVLDDLKEGDRKAISAAMMLLKQNNVTAVAAEGSTLKKLANKLDFSSMDDKVIPLKTPPSNVEPLRKISPK
jgi:hypothetical protein